MMVQRQCLDHDRQQRRLLAFAGPQIAKHEAEADEEDQKLEWCQQALNQSPARGITSYTLFRRVKRLAPRRSDSPLVHAFLSAVGEALE